LIFYSLEDNSSILREILSFDNRILFTLSPAAVPIQVSTMVATDGSITNYASVCAFFLLAKNRASLQLASKPLSDNPKLLTG